VSERGLSIRFIVKVDARVNLGDWMKCEGLAIEHDVLEYQEGGENTYVHRIPGRCKHSNIKLTRPLTKESQDVAAWVSAIQTDAAVRGKDPRSTAEITVLDATGEPVAQWHLDGVFPVRWTGPQLDVSASQAATETLELAHHGFLRGPAKHPSN
jgi:phage tail-like protein